MILQMLVLVFIVKLVSVSPSNSVYARCTNIPDVLVQSVKLCNYSRFITLCNYETSVRDYIICDAENNLHVCGVTSPSEPFEEKK